MIFFFSEILYIRISVQISTIHYDLKRLLILMRY
jgi:hypothetical protein